MHKNPVFLSIIGAIAIIALFLFSRHITSNQTGVLDTPQPQVAEPGELSTENYEESMAALENSDDSGVGSFAQLSVRGENLKCSFSTDGTSDTDFSSNGIVYISNQGRIKAEGVVSSSDQEFTFNFLDDAQYMYSWGSSASGAYAFKEPRLNSSVTTESFNPNRPLEYSCVSHDNSNYPNLFTPPSGIEFIDLDASAEGQFTAPDTEYVPAEDVFPDYEEEANYSDEQDTTETPSADPVMTDDFERYAP